MSALRAECARARRIAERLGDGESPAHDERRLHDEHLKRCLACRDALRESAALAQALRALPRPQMPAETLEAIWDHTVRRRRNLRWAAALRVAAALALTAGLAILWGLGPSGPTEAELRDAEADVRLVLGIAGHALDRTEEAAIETVLRDGLSRALDRLPVDWPEAPPHRRRVET